MPIYFFRHFYFRQFWFENNYLPLITSILIIFVFNFSHTFNKNFEIFSYYRVFFLNFSFFSHSFDFYPNDTKGVYLTGEKVADVVGVDNLPASRFKAQGSSLRGRMTLFFFVLPACRFPMRVWKI